MARHSLLDIHAESDATGARIVVTGELDMAGVPRLEQAVAQLLTGGARELMIDLGGLAFVDSSGLRMFIMLDDRARAEGWTLQLIRPPERTLAVFEVSGADESLPFVEEPESK